MPGLPKTSESFIIEENGKKTIIGEIQTISPVGADQGFVAMDIDVGIKNFGNGVSVRIHCQLPVKDLQDATTAADLIQAWLLERNDKLKPIVDPMLLSMGMAPIWPKSSGGSAPAVPAAFNPNKTYPPPR